MIVSILDWTMERFQDALLTEELDPGLFRRQGELGEQKEARINQFLDVLQAEPSESERTVRLVAQIAEDAIHDQTDLCRRDSGQLQRQSAACRKPPRFLALGTSIRESPNLKLKPFSATHGKLWAGPIRLTSPANLSPPPSRASPSLWFAETTVNLRAFYNVCRHHAAKVVTEPCGIASILHCPYHGWNYGLDGSLKGMPEFDGVKNFERQDNGLVPVKADTWEAFVFVNLDPQAQPLARFSRRFGEALRAARACQAALLR